MEMSKRRKESLIPLSRQHHYALLLCLRIHRGLKSHSSDLNWLQKQVQKTLQFFESDLLPHFHAEETTLFPLSLKIAESAKVTEELWKEHEEIRSRMESLRRLMTSSEMSTLSESLKAFADLLEMHIRKEERGLFPIYEEKVTPETDREIGEKIFEQIGSAMQPTNLKLLE